MKSELAGSHWSIRLIVVFKKIKNQKTPQILFLKCRRWGMPAHWLQVESCRVGFKSDEKASCSVFYLLKTALFSEGTMNALCLKRHVHMSHNFFIDRRSVIYLLLLDQSQTLLGCPQRTWGHLWSPVTYSTITFIKGLTRFALHSWSFNLAILRHTDEGQWPRNKFVCRLDSI